MVIDAPGAQEPCPVHVPKAPQVHVREHTRSCRPQLPQARISVCPGMHCVQSMHIPETHTRPAPHGVPSIRAIPGLHTGRPVLHVCVPVRHGLSGVHSTLSAQEPHTPSGLHTSAGPHEVPGSAAIGVSSQAGAPELHRSTPRRQGLRGTHGIPSAHSTHIPRGSHTRPIPHAVPAGRLPASRQVGAPLEQSIAPRRHGSATGHSIPARHATHTASIPHTRPSPQGVPAGLGASSTHRAMDPTHSTCPARHGLSGIHGTPAMHAPQVPAALHVRPPPHGVPSGRLPRSRHCGLPPVQSSAASWHGSMDMHAIPETHTTQLPSGAHTRPSAHIAPGIGHLATPSGKGPSMPVGRSETGASGSASDRDPSEGSVSVGFLLPSPVVVAPSPVGQAGPPSSGAQLAWAQAPRAHPSTTSAAKRRRPSAQGTIHPHGSAPRAPRHRKGSTFLGSHGTLTAWSVRRPGSTLVGSTPGRTRRVS
jgi:hypothetical protein